MEWIHHVAALCFGRVGRSTSQIFCPARFLFIDDIMLLLADFFIQQNDDLAENA